MAVGWATARRWTPLTTRGRTRLITILLGTGAAHEVESTNLVNDVSSTSDLPPTFRLSLWLVYLVQTTRPKMMSQLGKKLGLDKMRVSDPRNCVYFCVFRMSAPGAYHVPLIVIEQYGGLYEVLQGGAHLFEREVRL